MTAKTKIFTSALLLAVFVIALLPNGTVTDRQLAQQLLNSTQVEQAVLDGPPMFFADSAAVLFFEREGMQGPIHGVIVVQDGVVKKLILLDAREGHDHRVLNSTDFLNAFSDQPAKPPIIVDAISGATISSQAVSDAVNARLSQWVKYTAASSDSR